MKRDFSVVFIPTLSCNCNCSHCFEEILPISADNGSWTNQFNQLKHFSVQYNLNRLLIYWQGGEVMKLGPDAVKNGLETCEGIFNGSDIEIEHHLQSNLLLYDHAWKDIVIDYFRGNISSSLDFPNLYRRSGNLSFDEYNKQWLEKRAQAEADGIIVNLITLPNETTIENGAFEFYRYFSEEVGIRNVQINFPFPGVDGTNPALLLLDKLGDFMQDLYKIWVESDRSLNLNPFFALENRIYKNSGRLPCTWSYNCTNFILAVGPKGDIGQCDCWVTTRKEFNFGVLGETACDDYMNSANRQKFIERPTRMINDPECGSCAYWSICFGGCPIRALTFNGDMYTKDYYCPVYKKIFAAVLGDR